VGVSIWNSELNVFELLGYTSLVAPFPVSDDSSRQNCQEYTAVMLGLLLAKQLGVAPGFSFDITGDNTTSLACCRRGRVASEIARRANIGFSLLAVHLNALVAETTHVAGVDNVVYDGLSRGKSSLAVGLPEHLFVALPTDSPLVRYVALCDPAQPLVSTEDHTELSVQHVAGEWFTVFVYCVVCEHALSKFIAAGVTVWVVHRHESQRRCSIWCTPGEPC
jgi:hypothetical protein